MLTTNAAAELYEQLTGNRMSARRICQFCEEGRLGQKFGHIWMIDERELRKFAKTPRPTGRPPAKGRK